MSKYFPVLGGHVVSKIGSVVFLNFRVLVLLGGGEMIVLEPQVPSKYPSLMDEGILSIRISRTLKMPRNVKIATGY